MCFCLANFCHGLQFYSHGTFRNLRQGIPLRSQVLVCTSFIWQKVASQNRLSIRITKELIIIIEKKVPWQDLVKNTFSGQIKIVHETIPHLSWVFILQCWELYQIIYHPKFELIWWVECVICLSRGVRAEAPPLALTPQNLGKFLIVREHSTFVSEEHYAMWFVSEEHYATFDIQQPTQNRHTKAGCYSWMIIVVPRGKYTQVGRPQELSSRRAAITVGMGQGCYPLWRSNWAKELTLPVYYFFLRFLWLGEVRGGGVSLSRVWNSINFAFGFE